MTGIIQGCLNLAQASAMLVRLVFLARAMPSRISAMTVFEVCPPSLGFVPLVPLWDFAFLRPLLADVRKYPDPKTP